MIRLIPKRTIQVGPDDWAPDYQTVEVDLPLVEESLRGEWWLEGAELVPSPEPIKKHHE